MKIQALLEKYWSDQKRYWKDLKNQSKIHGLDRNFDHLYDEVHQKSAPIFIISTGRCGTALLTEVFKKNAGLAAVHEPVPELSFHSSLAFKKPMNDPGLKMAIDAVRYEYIRDTYLLGQRYVETNNRISFFAHYLAELFPKAQFIHLVRHPKAFIKSGLSRNWYSGKTLYDEGRIKDKAFFDTCNQHEKIAWLWAATNQFGIDFQSKYPNRCYTLKSEDLFAGNEQLVKSLQFLGLDTISSKELEGLTKIPVNKGKKVLEEFELEKLNNVPDFISVMNHFSYAF